MRSIVGILLLFTGVFSILSNWITRQKEQEHRLDEITCFMRKSRFAMETEKIQLIHFFAGYEGADVVLREVFQEISRRLGLYCYANGQQVWEEVFREYEKKLDLQEQGFQLLVQAGNGFFGHSRSENIAFLEKSITELELEKRKILDKHVQERKIWLPVGALGGLMLVIIWI